MTRDIKDRASKKAKSSATKKLKRERRKKALEGTKDVISSEYIEIHTKIPENKQKLYPHGLKQKAPTVPMDLTPVVLNNYLVESKNKKGVMIMHMTVEDIRPIEVEIF